MCSFDGTDLERLNSLGMAVALAYEVVRTRRSQSAEATLFDPTSSAIQPNARVFDVSSPTRIAKARAGSSLFDGTFRGLVETHGVSAEWPGFDILTIDPAVPSGAERLIELKSSGVWSRMQEMSWNEWKSARANRLRDLFYLYLVGNLRSDLQGHLPFIRTIRNPFEQLLGEVQQNERLERKVQLAVHLFRPAEHLDLTVLALQPRGLPTTTDIQTEL